MLLFNAQSARHGGDDLLQGRAVQVRQPRRALADRSRGRSRFSISGEKIGPFHFNRNNIFSNDIPSPSFLLQLPFCSKPSVLAASSHSVHVQLFHLLPYCNIFEENYYD